MTANAYISPMSLDPHPLSTIYDLLAAYLSKKGVSQQDLDQSGHDLPAMVDRAEECGLDIAPMHKRVLSARGRIYRERKGDDSFESGSGLMDQIIESIRKERQRPKE